MLLLERAGHVVVLAEEMGFAAVDAFRRERFHFVIPTDLQTPETPGIQATREDRTLEGPNGSPMLIVAFDRARHARGDCERCEHASIDGDVTKPIDRARQPPRHRFYRLSVYFHSIGPASIAV